MTPPPLLPHQQRLLDETWERPAWAVLFQTGVGKSCPTIHTAARLYAAGRIDVAIVLAPNNVHRNWVSDELPKHCPISYRALDWHTTRGKGQDRAFAALCGGTGFCWFALTFDALITPRGRQAVLDFTKGKRFLLVIDEGSRVKNPAALRTKKTAALRKLAVYARLLNGTPVTSGPTDLYSQIKILDEHFWIRHGIGSYTAFQSRFCVMKKIVVGGEDDADDRPTRSRGGPIVPHDADPEGVAMYEQLDFAEIAEIVGSPPATSPPLTKTPAKTTGRTIEVVVGYRDLEKLHEMIQPISTRLTKEQAGLDLPPKLYQRLVYDLAPEQRRVYDQLRKEFMVELDSGVLVTAAIAMVRILRLQQVCCGFLTDPNDPEGKPIQIIEGKNPRLDQFLDWTEDIGKQPSIVWCRFTHDVDAIVRHFGPARCVRYDGKVGEKDKALALDLFRSGKRQFCVAKAASMGVGLTLVESAISFIYSSTFSLFERLQLEDRQHRVGQHNPVTYVDLVADRTVDGKILQSLRENKDVADRVTGDVYRSWLEA